MNKSSSSYGLLREAVELAREEPAMHKRILAEVAAGEGRTIPEIAEALQYPSVEIVYWVMSMWKYGLLVESAEADEDGYFKYRAPQSLEATVETSKRVD